MTDTCCDLHLCANRATHVCVSSGARDFLLYLCDCHYERLRQQRPDLASCYEPLSPSLLRSACWIADLVAARPFGFALES